MPNITFLEPGTDATGDFSFFQATVGTVSSATDQAYTGSRSVKITTSNPAVSARVTAPAGIISDAGSAYSLWIRFNRLPDAQASIIQIQNNSATFLSNISLKTDGTLLLAAGASTTGTAVLAANTWYRVSLSYTITSTTVFEFRVYVNGVLDITGTTGTLPITGSNTIRPQTVSGTGIDFILWVDNWYVDDRSDLSDPGDVSVYAVPPASNNVNNFDSAIGANPANRWTNVNEVPVSQTNGWSQGVLADTQENYGLATAVAMDLQNYTALGRCAWIVAKGTLGGLGTPKIMDNGTETAVVLTSAAKLFTVYTTTSAYPSNAAGIGMRATNNADDAFLYECGTLVAVIPISGPRVGFGYLGVGGKLTGRRLVS